MFTLKRIRIWLTIFAFLPTALLACSSAPAGPQIEAHDAWGRPSPKMEGAGAVYVVIENQGREADWLTSADSPAAANVELHESYLDGDVMRMRPVPSLEIPANGSVELKPGGYHIMLINLNEQLEEGDVISVTLHFEQSSDITLDVSIQESE